MAKEFFRTLRIKEGERVTELPAFASIIRSFVAAAIKGNGPAQRAAIDIINMLEQEFADGALLVMNSQAEGTSHPSSRWRDASRLPLNVQGVNCSGESERAQFSANHLRRIRVMNDFTFTGTGL